VIKKSDGDVKMTNNGTFYSNIDFFFRERREFGRLPNNAWVVVPHQ